MMRMGLIGLVGMMWMLDGHLWICFAGKIYRKPWENLRETIGNLKQICQNPIQLYIQWR